MRSFESWLNQFCSRHRNFAIPNLMLYIVIGQAVVFLLDSFSSGYTLSSLLAFIPSAIFQDFQLWRLITFVFVPSGSNLLFTAISLYFYYSIGTTLERQWGSNRFTIFYAMGVFFNIIVGIILSLVYGFSFPYAVISISYINMSLFFAFASLYPDMQVLLLFIPIKVKWLGWLSAALFAWNILVSLVQLDLTGVLLPLVALLNYFLFFSGEIAQLAGRFKHQHSRQTINFKKAARDVKKDKGYLHKCSVCGVTDADDPNLEFRYCSKCKGYHCYCIHHINSHIHID